MSSSLGPPSTLLKPAVCESSRAAEPASRLPELLAPAGDWECAKAAVENGADAIYFGLERFNARMRAQNFTEADLPRLIAEPVRTEIAAALKSYGYTYVAVDLLGFRSGSGNEVLKKR